jgi:mRNA-degrading endonuclease RelE of RelBE toxin-antitoxin system
MNFSVIPLDSFKKNFKTLKKKYRNIKNDIKKLTVELQENPQAGIALQYNCYKLRVANSSVPTGKSGGFRTIYYFVDEHKSVYLIAIYSKTQKESISENELLELLKINGLDR